MIKIPISIGELIDKITILQIKKERIVCADKIQNIHKELNLLMIIANNVDMNKIQTELSELKNINAVLWDLENDIRQKEKDLCFDQTFIDLARMIYTNNDIRAQLKRKINITLDSDLIEEKSYQ